jgi:hydrogenase nickel incorporation protein HypA/HybF
MHELSIALSLLDIVENKCKEEGYHSVETVKVRIGKGSGVQPEAFSFALAAVQKDTIAKDTKFIIDLVPLSGVCESCGKQFESTDSFVFECPFCSSPRFKIQKGYELDIVEMEVND